MALQGKDRLLVADSLYWESGGLTEPTMACLPPYALHAAGEAEEKAAWLDVAGVRCKRHTSPHLASACC